MVCQPCSFITSHTLLELQSFQIEIMAVPGFVSFEKHGMLSSKQPRVVLVKYSFNWLCGMTGLRWNGRSIILYRSNDRLMILDFLSECMRSSIWRINLSFKSLSLSLYIWGSKGDENLECKYLFRFFVSRTWSSLPGIYPKQSPCLMKVRFSIGRRISLEQKRSLKDIPGICICEE